MATKPLPREAPLRFRLGKVRAAFDLFWQATKANRTVEPSAPELLTELVVRGMRAEAGTLKPDDRRRLLELLPSQ